MRYEHYLYGARPSPWPKAVIALDCDVNWSRNEERQERETASLGSWQCAVVDGPPTGYKMARIACGNEAEGFWSLLATAARRCNNLWIISTRFREVAAVLGLWERMESGYVRVIGKDHRRATPRGGNRRKQRSGICILEDPPIVMELRLAGCDGKITWVDAANYGVSTISGGENSQHDAGKLAEWFIRAASTLHSLGKCGWQATAASQAMHLFRCEYLETPILSHTEPRATALESSAMFGGRCECFQIGRIPGAVHLYDFRSLYPYLCATERVPCRLVGVESNPTLERLSVLQEMGLVIADVQIETDEQEYPYRDGFTVSYPVGRFSTALAGAELRHALTAGNVRAVRRCAWYEGERALARYAEEVYGIRQSADARADVPISSWAKRMLVALPGKFGQKIAAWEDMPDAECPWEWAEWYGRSKSGEPERWRVIAGNIQRESKGGFSHGAVPAIAAYVCSAGRARLLSAIRCAGMEHCYYCDTDSIVVDDYGAEQLTLGDWIRPGEWGFLQHVVSSADCEIFGVKHYRIGERTRESGRVRVAGGIGETSQGIVSQPWIGQSLRKQQPPADWRETHPYARGPGRYDQRREAGGRVKPPVVMEW